MINILIADDHPIMRKGLKQIVDETTDLRVTGEASDGREVIDLLTRERFDVLVLDISMPGMNGIEVLKRVRESHPRLPVLILTILPEERYATRIMAAGAAGYLTKDSAPDLLIDAVRRVAAGHKYVSDSVVNQLIEDLSAPRGRPLHESLSDRELDVLLRIARGSSLKEIGAELCLSNKTISTYRARILGKLGLKTTSDIIRYALEQRLVEG